MRKIIFAINITIDGFADHTAGIADDELHDFFADYLDNVDVVLMGRKTYELMEGYWPVAHEDPNSTKSTLRFADKFNAIHKIIFSNLLTKVNWKNSHLADKSLHKVVSDLKNQNGKDISAGSLSIASQLMKEDLVDEYLFLVHPIILGKGKQLFEMADKKINLNLIETKTFNSGVVVLHYKKSE